MNVRAVARFGILASVALALGWLESCIPIAAGMPGIKLGLANTILLYTVYYTDTKGTVCLMLTKVLLSGLLFSGLSGMLYSLAGGVFSIILMLLLHKTKGFGVIGVSIAGAAAHNIAQITVACFIVESRAVLAYLPVLLISAVLTGLLTGVIAKYVMKALPVKNTHSSSENKV